MKIGFIGCGNMASAMIKGLIQSKWIDASSILVSNRSVEKLKRISAQYPLQTTQDNAQVAKQSDVLILSVKPQMYEKVIEEIKDHTASDTLVLSIAPGFSLNRLQEAFGKPHKIIRCMPNTPAMVGQGMTAYVCNEMCSDKEKILVKEILCCFGRCAQVEEKQMDAVTAVSGSSPAYVYLFIEAMADAAVQEGLPRSMALEFAAQAVLGSAQMVLETNMHPGALKDMVCSPAGTTIEAVSVLEKRGFRGTVMAAMESCAKKSKEMSHE